MEENRIILITENKKRFLPLLLLADEQESMIDRYLGRGDLFVMRDQQGEALAVSVVTDEGSGCAELKNLAVAPEFRSQGLGRRMIDFVCTHCVGRSHTLLVGTGDVPSTVGFYEHCGFVRSHRVANFFIEHYDHPIYEDGVLLTDMVYLKKTL